MNKQAVSLDSTQARSLPGPGAEVPFLDEDFRFLSDVVYRSAGIVLNDSRRAMVQGRLMRRLRELNLGSISAYCEHVRNHGEDELGHLINAMTTNFTSFMRERHHFEYLRESLLPYLIEARAATRRLRIWSAGCSSGEEPYTLAMVLGQAVPAGWDARILATDLDTNVLARAEAGVYAEKDVQAVPAEWLRRWFLRGNGPNAGRVRVRDELKAFVTFRQLNLLEPWPMRGPFDAIFCRNVVIYFDRPTQSRIFDGFADLLAPDGALFIGHSENLNKVCDRFELVGQTVYRRVSQP
jgi:chemotaxis protein methyltransferase CheR